MFAWALEANAPAVLAAMRAQFTRHELASDGWIVEVSGSGARVIAGAAP